MTPDTAGTVAAAIGVIASLAAAVFWFRASVTKTPPVPRITMDDTGLLFEPAWKFLRATARLNALGAGSAVIASLAGAVGFYASEAAKHPWLWPF